MSAKDIEDKYYSEQDASIRYVYTETTEEWDKIENIFNMGCTSGRYTSNASY